MADLLNNNVTSPEAQQQAASVLKLFEHERRISVVEKDVERQGENIATLTREVYSLPTTLRDLMDSRVATITTDANVKFDKLTDTLGRYGWYMMGLLGGIAVDVIVHFLPKF